MKQLHRLKNTAIAWWDKDPFRLSAAVAYYTLFSLPGLLLIVVTAAGFFYGTDMVSTQIIQVIDNNMGAQTASTLKTVLLNTKIDSDVTLSSLVGIGTLLFGATAVFAQIQKAFNDIWEHEVLNDKGIFDLVKDRLLSFGLVVSIGFLLLVSLLVSTAIKLASEWLGRLFNPTLEHIVSALDIALSLGIITLLLAAMFKLLPDVKLRWSDMWEGAFITALLFVIAKFGLAYYFSNANPGSAYGAASSIIILLLWTSYGAMLILFGCEYTRIYSLDHKKDHPYNEQSSTEE